MAMDKKTYRGEWAGCSDYHKRKEELRKAHEEFLRMRENGFEVKEIKVRHRRPRILRPKSIITIVLGKEVRVTIRDYESHYRPCGFKIIREVY